MSNLANCPNCKVSLIGEEIPIESREHYGDSTHFKREIGLEYPEIYDGTLYWQCPDCDYKWPTEVGILYEKSKNRKC